MDSRGPAVSTMRRGEGPRLARMAAGAGPVVVIVTPRPGTAKTCAGPRGAGESTWYPFTVDTTGHGGGLLRAVMLTVGGEAAVVLQQGGSRGALPRRSTPRGSPQKELLPGERPIQSAGTHRRASR